MPEKYQTVLLFGPPGSGKGTQGRILGSIPGFFHFACGDVFRQLDPNSELGQAFYAYSSRGELVPDDLTIRLWTTHTHAQAAGTFNPASDLLILDGIPRSANQAKMLREHIDVLKVLHLRCFDEEAMIDRLRRRAIKENRIDDARESVIRHRWEVYNQETAPVLDCYPKDLIADIDAMPSPAEVLRQALDVLIPIQKAHQASVDSQ